jgi:hypothetical protein
VGIRFAFLFFFLLISGTCHAQVNSFNGRTGSVTLDLSDVTSALGYTPANKSGDTFTGPLNIGTAASPTTFDVFANPSGFAAPVGNNVAHLDIANGHFNFTKQITSGSAATQPLYVFYNQATAGFPTFYKSNQEYFDSPAVAIQYQNVPQSGGIVGTGQVNGLKISGLIANNNPFSAQNQGINNQMVRTGGDSSWGYNYQLYDWFKRPVQSFNFVGSEMDYRGYGSDTTGCTYDPAQCNRSQLYLASVTATDYAVIDRGGTKVYSLSPPTDVNGPFLDGAIATSVGGVSSIYTVVAVGNGIPAATASAPKFPDFLTKTTTAAVANTGLSPALQVNVGATTIQLASTSGLSAGNGMSGANGNLVPGAKIASVVDSTHITVAPGTVLNTIQTTDTIYFATSGTITVADTTGITPLSWVYGGNLSLAAQVLTVPDSTHFTVDPATIINTGLSNGAALTIGPAVVDGGVTWALGNAALAHTGRGIWLEGATGAANAGIYGTGLSTNAAFDNALIDASGMTCAPGVTNCAAMRLPLNVGIDFSMPHASVSKSEATKNQHLLEYSSFGNVFAFLNPNGTAWTIGDDANSTVTTSGMQVIGSDATRGNCASKATGWNAIGVSVCTNNTNGTNEGDIIAPQHGLNTYVQSGSGTTNTTPDLQLTSTGLAVKGTLTVSGGASVKPNFAFLSGDLGTSLAPGACTSYTGSAPGAAVGNVAIASPRMYPGDQFQWKAWVNAANQATVYLCNYGPSTATPTTTKFDVMVIQH